MVVLFRILLSATAAVFGWLLGVFCLLLPLQSVLINPEKTGGGTIGAHRLLIESLQRGEGIPLRFMAGIWITCFALSLSYWLIFGWGYRAAGMRLPRRGYWLTMGLGFGFALCLACLPWHNLDLSGGTFWAALRQFLLEFAVLLIWIQMICLPMVYVLMRPTCR
jgi:hypothetical protein